MTDDNGKVQGTFFIRHNDGEVLELFLVPARKGLPPNPYDRSGISQSWLKTDVEEAREWVEELKRRAAMTPEERARHLSIELEELEAIRKFTREQNPEEPEDHKAYQDDVERRRRSWSGEVHQDTRPLTTDHRAEQGRSGFSEAHKESQQRPAVGIFAETALDGDVRFKFRAGSHGFRLRGSKLGPVLLAFRQAGRQKVTAKMIQAAVEHVA